MAGKLCRGKQWDTYPSLTYRLVSRLKGAGYTRCVAVFNEPGCIQHLPVVVSEPPGDMPTCYFLSVDEDNFLQFHRELGPFRFLLTTDDRSWAISCTEWYNLFAGEQGLIEALLGKSIEQARQEFLEFASLIAKGSPDDPLMQVVKRYAAP